MIFDEGHFYGHVRLRPIIGHALALLVMVCGSAFQFPYWLVRWILGCDLGYITETGKAKVAIKETVEIFAILLAQLVSLNIALEGQNGPGYEKVSVFSIFGFFSVGALVLILRSRDACGKMKMHTFDHGTIQFARCTLFASLVVIGGAWYTAHGEGFLKQTMKVELAASQPTAYEFLNDKRMGLRFTVEIKPGKFPGEQLPETLDLRVKLAEKLLSYGFTVKTVTGAVIESKSDSDGAVPMDPPPSIVDVADDDSQIRKIFLVDLKPHATYRIAFLLHTSKELSAREIDRLVGIDNTLKEPVASIIARRPKDPD